MISQANREWDHPYFLTYFGILTEETFLAITHDMDIFQKSALIFEKEKVTNYIRKEYREKISDKYGESGANI